MAAAELPAWDQPAPEATPAPTRGPAMGPVAQLEADREYSTEELDVLEKSSTPPPPQEFTSEELDMEAARLFDDPTYSPTRDEYFELKATKERLKAEGKLPGTAELAAKAVGGLFVTAIDAVNSTVFSPAETLAQSPATLQTGIGRAALGAMQLGGWAKEAIQGTPKYRDEETGEFFFYNNEVQLQNALDAGRKLRPTTDDDLKDHEFEGYIAKKGIDAEYQALGEKTAPTELLTRLITGRNQQETPNIAQAGALEIVADPTNLIPLGAGAKTLGLSRLGKTVSAQTAGVISKVAGGLADGGDALAGRFADVVTNTTGLTPSTAGNVVKTLTRASVGGGIAAGASALGAPPEVAATIAGFYPAYKAGIGVLRKIETGAGAAKIILRESADATNGLDQAARAAVLANPSVPQFFKEVLERPSNFVPIESTPARLAAEQSLSPQMRGLMGKLANPAIVQSVRAASTLAKGAVKGTAINAPFSLLAANAGDDEEAAAMLGAGAAFGALGGGVDRFTGLQQRRQQAAISDVSRMLVDVELAGGDVGKMMSTQTPESLVKLASLQGTFRNGLDLIPLNATDYNANVAAQGGAGSAGLHVQAPAGQRAKVYINLDAKRQGIEPHEFGHALLASGALDGQQKFAARAWVDKTYGAEGIKARAAEYASNIIRAKNAEAFPEGSFEITPTTLASEMESLTQGGLARGDMDGLDWARDEIFAETFAKASETMDFNAIRRGAPAGGNFLTFAEGILGAQARALSASGVRIDPQTGAPLEKPADLFAKNPLLATDKALVKQLGTYINNYRQWANNPGHEKPAGVRVAPSGRASDIANNPQVTFYDRGDGIKANAFAIQDPATGQAILRDQRDLNAEHAKVREQLKALGGSKLLEPANPVLGPKKTSDGRVTIRGKVLPPQFDFLNGFMPHIRNFARQFEQFGQTGESMQVRYHAIGSGDSGAFRIKNLGNLEAVTREVLPFEWQLTKAGNLNAVVLDLTQFRNRALRAINNRNEALAPFNFEIGQLEADLKVWMDNHRNNLPGENKIGTDKRDAINALVGLATIQNRTKNPLNGSFGPGSAIKQFRLDRVDAAIGTGRQGYHFDYERANGNRLPEIQSPLPDLSRDIPPANGQAMPDITITPDEAKRRGLVGPVYHGSPDFKGQKFDPKYRARNSGLSRGGFSFTDNVESAKGYASNKIDSAQSAVDSANDVMRELAGRMDNGLKVDGFADSAELPEFNSSYVDDIESLGIYFDEIANKIPKDLGDRLRAAASKTNEPANPVVVEAFLRNPKVTEINGKKLWVTENPDDIFVSGVTKPPQGQAMPKNFPTSGKPFEFFSIRNKEKSPFLGSRFGQDIEPHGRYMTESTPSAAQNLDSRFEKGVVRFENPLVVEFGGGYGDASNWKNVLSSQFDGKTGFELSQAIRNAGHDGIITVEPSKGPNRPAHTSEIVDLRDLSSKGQAMPDAVPDKGVEMPKGSMTQLFTTAAKSLPKTIPQAKSVPIVRVMIREKLFDDDGKPVLDKNGKQKEGMTPKLRDNTEVKFQPGNFELPLPNYQLAKSKFSLGNKNFIGEAVKNRDKVIAAIEQVNKATEVITNDPFKFTDPKGYAEIMRDAGVTKNILVPPSGIDMMLKRPKDFIAMLDGGFHGPRTVQGTKAAAMAGLDGVVEMRQVIGEKPTEFVTALHHLWGTLSKQLPPLDQEALWMRLVLQPEVIQQIQNSIDGTFKLKKEQWKSIVDKARKATKGQYGKLGNNATSNANSFYLMLKNHNGRWNQVANLYATDSAIDMRSKFNSLGHGATGIKNKVQGFIGLTFGIKGTVLDRWRFVDLYMAPVMQATGAPTHQHYFQYTGDAKRIPEDPIGIYANYGTIENDNPAFSLALYNGIDRAAQAAINASPDLKAYLGNHADPGGLHWVTWNAIKNEAVGHSSLDLTKNFLKQFQREGTAQDWLNFANSSKAYVEGQAANGREIIRLSLDNGVFDYSRQ